MRFGVFERCKIAEMCWWGWRKFQPQENKEDCWWGFPGSFMREGIIMLRIYKWLRWFHGGIISFRLKSRELLNFWLYKSISIKDIIHFASINPKFSQHLINSSKTYLCDIWLSLQYEKCLGIVIKILCQQNIQFHFPSSLKLIFQRRFSEVIFKFSNNLNETTKNSRGLISERRDYLNKSMGLIYS